jgi:hypothetical protein
MARLRLAALVAALFLLGHAGTLPRSLEDLDSVNFALGIRAFDIAAHQPHAPGYPVYVGLAKISSAMLALFGGVDDAAREARALAVWSVLAGALAAFALVSFFVCLERDGARALAATILTLASPLFWFTAARPMSDVPGFASALVSIALFASAFVRQRVSGRDGDWRPGAEDRLASGRLIVLGSFAAGIALGVRSQGLWLTVPLFGLVMIDRVGKGFAGVFVWSVAAFAAGVLVWFIPLVGTTGGPGPYLGLVRAQAIEDFAGVDMLYRDPSARRLALALWHTLVLPWANVVVAAIVLSLAGVGGVAMARRSRPGLLLLLGVFGVYGLFHLLFQETVTLRYGLPFVAAISYLAVRGLGVLAGRFAVASVTGLALACLVLVVPPLVEYSRQASPAFQAAIDLREKAAASAPRMPIVAMHYELSRALRGEVLGVRQLPSPPREEWKSVARYWADGGESPVWFLANTRRTDLAFVDPASRPLVRSYRWPFDADVFLGGIRPRDVDWYALDRPGWFVDEGWALTPELAGVASRAGHGPDTAPIVAFGRRRAAEAIVMIGGRHLGRRGDPDVRIQLALDGTPIESWTAAPEPGFFLRFVALAPGALAGSGEYARLAISSQAVDGRSTPVRTAIEQFDLQSSGAVVWGFDTGWHEQEYNPATGASWRWTSGSAEIAVRGTTRDLILVVDGESPLRTFDTAPTVTVKAGGRELSRAAPADDFRLEVPVPGDVLAQSAGTITITTDRVFVPAERSQSTDRRSLGLRIFRVSVRPAS